MSYVSYMSSKNYMSCVNYMSYVIYELCKFYEYLYESLKITWNCLKSLDFCF